jgi:hypothetical protein
MAGPSQTVFRASSYNHEQMVESNYRSSQWGQEYQRRDPTDCRWRGKTRFSGTNRLDGQPPGMESNCEYWMTSDDMA